MTVDEFGLFPSWKRQQNSVWEIRAGETRSFGWFVRPNLLVIVDGALKIELLDETGKEIDARYRGFFRLVDDWRLARGVSGTEVSHETDHKKLIT